MQGGVGEGELEVLDYAITQYTVQPHKVLQVEVPDGKASLLHDSIYLRFYTQVSSFNVVCLFLL